MIYNSGMNTTAKLQKTGAKAPVKRSKYDSAWKNIMQKLFKDFLAFFFPAIHDVIDFSKRVIFLDKELRDIDPESNLGDRVADLLARVHLKKEHGGGARNIRIITHIEIQGKDFTRFMERMFIYFIRAFDREKREKTQIISLAILTDEDPACRPTEYGYEFCGFKLLMQIPIVKLIDYKYNPELIAKMETSDNPMVMVVKAQLKSLELKGADNNRKFEALKELIRLCYQKKYSQEYTHLILKFFALAIRVPVSYKKSLKEVIIKAEEEFNMEYVPLWLRDAEKVGMKKAEKKIFQQVVDYMLGNGLDIGKIAELTGFKKEDIEKLYPTSH